MGFLRRFQVSTSSAAFFFVHIINDDDNGDRMGGMSEISRWNLMMMLDYDGFFG